MTRRTQIWILIGVAAAIGAGAAAWHYSRSPVEREIERRLHEFASEFNAGTTDGFGTVARAARLGSYFTDDVVIDLGQGSPPISGRETLMGIAARLQPRTAAFVLEIDDVLIESHTDDQAEIALTIVIRRRSFGSGEESIDAREFAARVIRQGGDWVVSRVTAVDTLR